MSNYECNPERVRVVDANRLKDSILGAGFVWKTFSSLWLIFLQCWELEQFESPPETLENYRSYIYWTNI